METNREIVNSEGYYLVEADGELDVLFVEENNGKFYFWEIGVEYSTSVEREITHRIKWIKKLDLKKL